MATEKRARKKANRQARLEAEERARSRAARTRLAIRVGIIVVVAVVGLVVYNVVAGDDGDDGEDVSAAAASTTTADGEDAATAGTATSTPSTTSADDGDAASEASVECPAADGSSDRRTSFPAPPPTCIDPGASYSAEVTTSEGTFTIDLDPDADDAAVNNFVYLARYHFYDGLDFHRVVPDFVIQGGDPAGDGTGGPGYQWTGGRPESSAAYTAGSVSMANSGSDPSTNGSQFFVALDDVSDRLSADFTYFGQVSEGFEVVEAIGALGEGDGPPSRPVTIDSVTITES